MFAILVQSASLYAYTSTVMVCWQAYAADVSKSPPLQCLLSVSFSYILYCSAMKKLKKRLYCYCTCGYQQQTFSEVFVDNDEKERGEI